MADRTVNININYKINTSDVEKAKQASAAAQQATDNLRNAASKAGSSGATAFKPFIGSIETLNAKVLSLKDRIIQSSDPKVIQRLSEEYKRLKTQLDATNKSLFTTTQATKSVAENTKSLGNQFTGLVSTVKLLLTAGLVKEFVQTSIEAAALSGKVQGLERAFNTAFPNATLILADLRRATHGTVVDFELMQRTLQATNLGVSVEKLPILFEFAAARAQQTGESVDYLVDSIVRGIGRKSLLILDNLGLSATRLKEQFHGASLQSQSVGDVTTAVAAIAKEELGKMGGYLETNATRVDQLKSSWTQLGVEISKLASGKGGVIGFLKGYTDAFGNLIESINKGITVEENLRQKSIQSAAVIGVNIIKQNEFTGVKEHDLKITREIIAERTTQLIQQQDEIKNLQNTRKAVLAAAQGYDAVIKAGEQNSKQQKDLKLANLILIDQIKILKGVESELVNELNKKDEIDRENTDTLKVLEARVKSLNEQLEDTDKISTKGGINQARIIKNQINDTQEKIDQIKHQIFLEEDLQKRRENLKAQKIEPIDGAKVLSDIIGVQKKIEPNIPAIVLPAPEIPESAWDKLGDSFKDHMKEIISSGIDIINGLAQSQLQQETNDINFRIQQTQDFYQNQINLAGDNEKAKDKLRNDEAKKIKQLQVQRAEAERKAALGGIMVNTALGIIKAIATAVTIYDGLVESAVVAAEGAAQYAVASNARYYAKGALNIQGPGTSTSDSIPANLSVGESVMTADETKRSFGILKAIRTNKIDDRILKNIDFSGGRQTFDDARMVNILDKIEKKKTPDLVKQGRLILEVHKEGENFKKFIRSKSM